MTARPPTTYLGTRSHFRSGPIKSYRALLSTAIRRKFGGSEESGLDSDDHSPETSGSANNNKRSSSNPPTGLSSDRAKSHPLMAQPLQQSPDSKLQERNDESAKDLLTEDANMNSSQATTTSSSLPIVKSEPMTSVVDATVTSNCHTTSSQGLPSPASSTSETSDYQRSTPSPRDSEDAANECMENWCKNEEPDITAGDEGFSESLPLRRAKRSMSDFDATVTANEPQNLDDAGKSFRRNSMSNMPELRVALEKIPCEKISTSVSQPLTVGMKRSKRSSSCGGDSNASSETALVKKKIKLDANSKISRVDTIELPLPRPLTLSQNKITDYLSETKLQFNSIRKRTLDKFLNLKAEPLETTTTRSETTEKLSTSPGSESPTSTCSSTPTKVKEEIIVDVSTVDDSTPSSNLESLSTLSTPVQNSDISNKCDEGIFEVPQQPIRFPVNRHNSHFPSESVICKWVSCGIVFETSGKLLDHLKTVHAISQVQSPNTSAREESTALKFKCFWEGCKVFGKGSSSKSWLEKHVTNHGGNKPFQCIVDGCHQRFSTQSLLERHVNNHFKSSTSVSNSGNGSGLNTPGSNGESSRGSSGGNDFSFPKFIRKIAHGRKVKYRRTIYSARIFDLFDIGVMSEVRQKLSDCEARCDLWRSSGHLEASRYGRPLDEQVILFRGQPLARRMGLNGQEEVLQHWKPENILEDEWVPAERSSKVKKVKISSLPFETRSMILTELFDGKSSKNLSSSSTSLKCRRKKSPQPRTTALS